MMMRSCLAQQLPEVRGNQILDVQVYIPCIATVIRTILSVDIFSYYIKLFNTL